MTVTAWGPTPKVNTVRLVRMGRRRWMREIIGRRTLLRPRSIPRVRLVQHSPSHYTGGVKQEEGDAHDADFGDLDAGRTQSPPAMFRCRRLAGPPGGLRAGRGYVHADGHASRPRQDDAIFPGHSCRVH